MIQDLARSDWRVLRAVAEGAWFRKPHRYLEAELLQFAPETLDLNLAYLHGRRLITWNRDGHWVEITPAGRVYVDEVNAEPVRDAIWKRGV